MDWEWKKFRDLRTRNANVMVLLVPLTAMLRF